MFCLSSRFRNHQDLNTGFCTVMRCKSYMDLVCVALRILGRITWWTDVLHGYLFQAVRRMKSSPLTTDEVACIEEVGYASISWLSTRNPLYEAKLMVICIVDFYASTFLMWSLKYITRCLLGDNFPIIFWLLPVYTMYSSGTQGVQVWLDQSVPLLCTISGPSCTSPAMAGCH